MPRAGRNKLKLYHGTPNLARVLKAGGVKPSNKPEPLPDLASTLDAYRELLASWRRRWPDPPEPWYILDRDRYGGWVDATLIPMRNFAYATTRIGIARIYARMGKSNPDSGVVEVVVDADKLLPDEDWIGCVAAYAFTDCSDCNLDVRGNEAAYDAWAAALPRFVSPALIEEVSAEREFIETEIDYDGFCALPMSAVLGRTVIRDASQTEPGLRWLHAGLAFTDRFAHLGPMQVVGVVPNDTEDEDDSDD